MLFISRFKLEFSFIKQKVISQDSSGSVVKGGVLGVEVPGSNSGKFFQRFCALFYPMVTAVLEYFNPAILNLFGFCFITLLL